MSGARSAGKWGDSVVELPKGGNTVIRGPVVRSLLRTQLAPGQIDICALLVDDHRRTRSDEDFVFFNRERSRCGSTRRVSPVEIEVALEKVPAAVDAIVIAASLDDSVGGSVAEHGSGGITFVGDPAVTHALTGLTTERCVIAAELYRRNGGWKVRAISQGFDDLAGLIAVFGVQTDDADTPPAPASPTRVGAGASTTPSGAPPQTRELLDRVRAGAATRRADASPPARLPTWLANLNGRRTPPPSQQLSAYRARRRAEAAQVATDIAIQTQRVEQLLQQLPYRDLTVPTLLGLIDASESQPRQPRVRLFRRTQPTPPPVPPSTHLAAPLAQLHRAASTPSNRDAVHAWLWLGLHAVDLQPSFGHAENINVAPDGGKIVIDVRLPDRATVIPEHSRAVYTPGDDTIRYHPAKPKEQSRLADILISSALLAQAHAAATATSAAGLPSTLPLVVNGWETAIDPASGRPARICRATLATSTDDLARIDLRAVDPPTCLRSFAGTLNEAGTVAPIATPSGTTPAGREIDLATIDPYEFEGLITDLAQAMGYTAYRTPRSHDHGVDVYVESRDTLAGGRIVISAKRYNHTVGPDHVRALDSVIGDQGAIKGILVTTSGFGPESYRIARDKPLDLVDGQRLRAWLHEYLGVTGR
jgi:stress response protein SCP2